MKSFLILVVCVATVVNGGRFPKYRRTNTELVDLFSELGADLASKLAEKLEAIDLDLTEPVTEEDPAKTWRAVETIVATVVEEVIPEHCKEAAEVHAVAGYARHLVMEVIIFDLLETTEEMGELTYLANLKPRKVSRIPKMYGEKTSYLENRFNEFGMDSSMTRNSEQFSPKMRNTEDIQIIKEVMTKIAYELKEKLAGVEAAIGNLHLGSIFGEMQGFVEADILVNKPVGKVLKKVATTIHKYMEPFKTGEVRCDITADMKKIERSFSDVIDFLDGGFEESLETMRIPRHMEEILKGKLISTLPEVAEILKQMVETVPNEDFVGFFKTIFRETADKVVRGVKMACVAEEVVRKTTLTTFIEKLITEGKTGEITKLIYKIPAMTLASLDFSPEEIRYALRQIDELLLEGGLSEQADLYF